MRAGSPAVRPGRTSTRAAAGVALAVVLLGVLITGIDTTVVVLALPDMESDLDAPLTAVIWVVIGYLLVNTLLTTQTGRIGDMFGRVRIYQIGFLIFTLASVLCAVAWNATSIVGARVLQGVGAACITANSGAIISEIFPREERGKAYGYVGVCWSLGAVLGIVFGGLFVTYATWPWVFWINLPIGATVLALARRLPRQGPGGQRRRFDLAGMCALGVGLLSVLWAVTRLVVEPLSPMVLLAVAFGLGCLAGFVAIERTTPEPMLRLGLFRIPTLGGSLLCATLQGTANYAVLWLAFMCLHGPLGLAPIHAALLMVPGYALAGILSPWTGGLTDRYGPVRVATTGLAVEAVAFFVYAHVSLAAGAWPIIIGNIVNGIGLGLFVPANNAAVMKAAPAEFFGISAGTLRTFASIGWVFSFPVAFLFAARAIPRDLAIKIFVGASADVRGSAGTAFATGLRTAFYVLMALVICTTVVSALRTFGGTREREEVNAPAP